MNISVIILFILFSIGFIFLYQYAGRYVYNYRLKNKSIQLVLFKIIPIRNIYLKNIVEIKKSSFRFFWEEFNPLKNPLLFFISEQWVNRFWGDRVVIHKKGLTKFVFLSPDNADDFIGEAQEQMKLNKESEKNYNNVEYLSPKIKKTVLAVSLFAAGGGSIYTYVTTIMLSGYASNMVKYISGIGTLFISAVFLIIGLKIVKNKDNEK